MTGISNIFYPREPGYHFDKAYYCATHMPLCQEKWKRFGFQSWEMVELTEDAPYIIQCIVRWDSPHGFDIASREGGQEVFDDIANYTNLKPIIVKGEVKGSSAA